MPIKLWKLVAADARKHFRTLLAIRGWRLTPLTSFGAWQRCSSVPAAAAAAVAALDGQDGHHGLRSRGASSFCPLETRHRRGWMFLPLLQPRRSTGSSSSFSSRRSRTKNLRRRRRRHHRRRPCLSTSGPRGGISSSNQKKRTSSPASTATSTRLTKEGAAWPARRTAPVVVVVVVVVAAAGEVAHKLQLSCRPLPGCRRRCCRRPRWTTMGRTWSRGRRCAVGCQHPRRFAAAASLRSHLRRRCRCRCRRRCPRRWLPVTHGSLTHRMRLLSPPCRRCC